MDNNLTNIDDLFKQRLGNAEEAGRPGSWLKMKELLDEQMPVGTVPTAAANGNKRKLGLAALLLLLSAITIGGGYQMYSSFRGSAVSEDTLALYTNQSSGNGVIGAVSDYADNQNARPYNEFANTDENTSATTSESAITGSAANNTTKTVVIGNTQSTTTSGVSSTSGVTKRNNSAEITVDNNSGNQLKDSDIQPVKQSVAKVSQDVTKVEQNVTKINTQEPQSINANNLQPKAIAGNTTATTTTSAATTGNIATKPNEPQKPVSKDVAQLAMNSGSVERMNNTGNKQLPSGLKADLNLTTKEAPNNSNDTKTVGNTNLDTFKKIELKESVAKDGRVLRDTTSIGNVIVKSNKPANKEGQEAEATVAMNNNKSNKDALPEELLLQAQKADLETEDGAGVYTDLSKNKVSSHKMKNYNEHRFEEMVRNAKFKLKSVKFYPGLVAGVNSSVGGNNVTGFQLGFVGDVALGNKWSVLTELKYVQRFNNKIDFSENYYTNLDSSYNSGGGKVYTFDSVGNSYNFSTLGSFELPIALRYNVKRFNIFGGANLAYHLKTKVSQVDIPNQITKEGATGFRPDYNQMAGAPSVRVSDFTNRFTVGYLLGVSYNWSPSMRLDMRLTQSVWDNASTNGQKTISKELYRTPNVQLNLSYRFKQKAYKKFR